MVRATLIFQAVLTLGLLAWSALCVPLDVLAHPSMEMMKDAQTLWHSVTRRNILPGTLHSVNAELGVTQRWHDFLRKDALGSLSYIVE